MFETITRVLLLAWATTGLITFCFCVAKTIGDVCRYGLDGKKGRPTLEG